MAGTAKTTKVPNLLLMFIAVNLLLALLSGFFKTKSNHLVAITANQVKKKLIISSEYAKDFGRVR